MKVAILEPKMFEPFGTNSKVYGFEYKLFERFGGLRYQDHGKMTLEYLVRGMLTVLDEETLKENMEIYLAENNIVGLDWCIKNDVRVLSMSTNDCGWSLENPDYENKLAKTCLMFTSAGNTGNYTDIEKRKESGAAIRDNWITIGAIDSNNNPQQYSSYGADKVFLVAKDNLNDYYGDEGTSFSTPFVAGKIAAYILSEELKGHTKDISYYKQYMIDNSIDIYEEGKDSKTGYGTLDIKEVVMTNDPQSIVIHHSYTEDNKLLSSFEALRHYHMTTKGFSEIAYHGVIEYVDNKLTFKKGRDVFTRGAHTKEMNKNFNSLGWCIVGNFDKDTLNEETINFILQKQKEYEIWLNRKLPLELHRTYATYKSCPGNNITLDTFKGEPMDKNLQYLKDNKIIDTPEYWQKLIDENADCSKVKVEWLIALMKKVSERS